MIKNVLPVLLAAASFTPDNTHYRPYIEKVKGALTQGGAEVCFRRIERVANDRTECAVYAAF
jgi:hypothetical protein